MSRPKSTQPTDGELEILKFLWRSQPSELGKICAALREHREVATTTVATMLKVMKEKGLVRREKGPRGYLWSPVAAEDKTARQMVSKLVDDLFDGSAHRLVAHLLEDEQLTAEEREDLQRMLDASTPARNRKKGGTR